MKITIKLGLMVSSLSFAAELDLRGAKMLEYCVQDEYESCEDAVSHFLETKDLEPAMIASDFICVNKSFKENNGRYFFCYTAGILYLTEKNDYKLALSKLKISCSIERAYSDPLVKEILGSTCALVAAIENNALKYREELSRIGPQCTDTICFESLAFAAAIMKDEAKVVEFLSAGINKGSDIKEIRKDFARFAFLKKSKGYRHLTD